jgi:hypothetical protein
MMTLVAAALAAAAPAPAADAHAQHLQSPSGHHQMMMDCCKDEKADCKDCCEDMEKTHSGSEHGAHPQH